MLSIMKFGIAFINNYMLSIMKLNLGLPLLIITLYVTCTYDVYGVKCVTKREIQFCLHYS